ncbi:MAG: DUF4115 domain-containing protein, partial [Pseudomonadota bacterium]|nr:DUF4115 domain-containing protein [Pseudomonadota bacterium]
GALVVYVLWLVAGTQNDGITVSAVVQTPAAPVQAPAAPTQPAVVADEAAAASAAAVETPATPRAPDGAAPAAATIEGPADVKPNAQLIDTTPASSKVEIRATRRTWMRLENAQGRVLFSSVIDEGEGFELPDDMDYILATRDAGALTYFVNNQAVAPVGRRGQILTNRNLKRADIAAQAQ